MKHVIALGLGLLLGASATFAADAGKDATAPSTDAAKTATKPAAKAPHKSKALKRKASVRTAKALKTTGDAMEGALKK